MTDTEPLVIEMAAGLKLVTGTLGLTVALLPDADRAPVIQAVAAPGCAITALATN